MKKMKSILPRLIAMGFASVLSLTPATAYAAENGSQEDLYKPSYSTYMVHWNDAYGYMHSFECESLDQAIGSMGALDYILTNCNPNYECYEKAAFNAGIIGKENCPYGDYVEGRFVPLDKEERNLEICREFDTEQWIDEEQRIKDEFFGTEFFNRCRYEWGQRGGTMSYLTSFVNQPASTFAQDWYYIFKYEKKDVPITIEGEEYGTVDFSRNYECRDIDISRLDENNEICTYLNLSGTSNFSTSYYMERENTMYTHEDGLDTVYFTVDWAEDYENVSVTCEEARNVTLVEDEKTGVKYYEMYFDAPPEGTKRTSATIKLVASNPKESASVVTSETPEEPSKPTPSNNADDIDTDKKSNLLPIVLVVGALLAGGSVFFFFILRKK
ncbi:MAG: hypothetical protein ACI4HQ_01145 [Acetatifactor sp.]